MPAKHQREFMRIVGRGPDLTVIQRVGPNLWLGFHRLAIVQPGDTPSAQPICGEGLAVVCNGEIYNHLALKEHSPMDNHAVRWKIMFFNESCQNVFAGMEAAIVQRFCMHSWQVVATCGAVVPPWTGSSLLPWPTGNSFMLAVIHWAFGPFSMDSLANVPNGCCSRVFPAIRSPLWLRGEKHCQVVQTSPLLSTRLLCPNPTTGASI